MFKTRNLEIPIDKSMVRQVIQRYLRHLKCLENHQIPINNLLEDILTVVVPNNNMIQDKRFSLNNLKYYFMAPDNQNRNYCFSYFKDLVDSGKFALSNADFTGAYISIFHSLSVIDCTNKDFSGSVFCLSNLICGVDFANSNLENVVFKYKVEIGESNWKDTCWIGANFSGLYLIFKVQNFSIIQKMLDIIFKDNSYDALYRTFYSLNTLRVNHGYCQYVKLTELVHSLLKEIRNRNFIPKDNNINNKILKMLNTDFYLEYCDRTPEYDDDLRWFLESLKSICSKYTKIFNLSSKSLFTDVVVQFKD